MFGCPSYILVIYTRNAITFANSMKTILKSSIPLALSNSFLPYFFYIRKCSNNCSTRNISYLCLAPIYQLGFSLKVFFKKIFKLLVFINDT